MDKLNVLVSLITEDNEFQLEQAASAKAAALNLGATVQITFANNDAVQQTQQILQYMQKPSMRLDAILVEPVGTGMLQIAKAALSARIGWGVINAGVDYLSQLRKDAVVPVFSVVSDNEEIGRIQGRQIAAILGDGGCVLYIEGPTIRDVAGLRTKGMLATKPQGVTVKTLRGDWTQRSGYHAIQSWLALSTSKEMHVGMIVCQNDDMAAGARRALGEVSDLKQRARWLELPVTGCDGVPNAGQKWVRQGCLTATVLSPPLVGNALQLLCNWHNAGTQPPEVTVVAPCSFPSIAELQKKYSALGRAAGQCH